MEPPIAKLSRPRAAKVLARSRLFERLDEARGRPVVWVAGPPGSGKTTLISTYLASRRLSGLWYQIDAGDSDLATFFHYLGLAVQQAVSRHHTPRPPPPPRVPGGAPDLRPALFRAALSVLEATRRGRAR
jgi:ATP/maltotriose-dependent transcriptional regulator MalT